MEYENRHKKAFFIQTMIILSVSLVSFITALLTGMLKMAAISGVTLLFGLLKVRSLRRPRDVYRGTCSFVTAIILSLIFFMFTSPICSYFKFQYPFVRAIDGPRQGEAFIRELPKGASDYSYESMPTIMQGDGFHRLHFRAPAGYTEDLRKDCEADAITSFKASALETDADDIRFFYSELFNEHPDGMVYVFSYIPGNHAHFLFILIDRNDVYCYHQ